MREYIFAFFDKFFFWAGIAMLILDLIKRHIPKYKEAIEKLPHRLFWGISAVCLFIAGFQVWHEEHIKYEAELKKHTPNLEFSYKQIATGQLKTEQGTMFGGDAMVTISGQMSNSGLMPSIVRNWALSISIPGETMPRIGVLIGTNAKSLNLDEQENFSWEHGYLPELTATQPINPGYGPIGFIVFRLPGVQPDKAWQKGVVYGLSWEDVTGKKGSKDFVMTGASGSPIYIPGMPRGGN